MIHCHASNRPRTRDLRPETRALRLETPDRAAVHARIAVNLPRLDCLVLHGIGEPTLNPEYLEIVALAAATGRFGKIMANSHALSRSIDYYHQLPIPVSITMVASRFNIDDVATTLLAGYLRRAPGFCGGCQRNARPVAESFVPLMRHPAGRVGAGERLSA